MTDIELQLSSFFHEEADKATLPGAMYRRVFRRARIRRGVTVAMTGLAVVAIGMVTVMGAHAFQSSSPIGPVAPGPSPTPSPTPQDTGDGVHETGPKVTVAQGTVSSKAWALIAYESNAGLCVDLQIGSGSGGGCGFDVPDERDLGLSLGSQLGLSKTIIHGVVSKRVASLQVRLDDDEKRNVEIIEGPERFDVNFFAAFLPKNGTGILQARDDEGAVLQQEHLSNRPFPAGEREQTSPNQDSDSSTCTDRPRIQEAHGAYGTILSEATTPVVKIALGEREGKSWSLCAYRAMVKKNDEAPRDSFCVEFKFGPGPYAGYTCLNLGADAPPGADYFLRAGSDLSKEEGAAYYGAISQRVQRVVIRLSDGTENEATIFEPPEELGMGYRFFVGFAPPGEDVTVSVEDDSGRELEKESWKAQG